VKKNKHSINNIGIIGAGTMGSGIASVCAMKGYDTFIYDVKKEIIEKAENNIKNSYKKLLEKDKIDKKDVDTMFKKLRFVDKLEELKNSDLIIEAAVENIDIKRQIFRHLETICKPDSIFATNTSSISVTAISSILEKKERFVGMHFFNPANVMKLVEVIKGDFTSDEVLKTIVDLCEKLDKKPVICRDTPAFIVNRIARSFYGESLKILGEGNIDHVTIDNVMKQEGGFSKGPFELMDLIGIDVNFSVTKSVYEAFFYDPKYKPHPIQQKMVESGLLGRKTKQGFYKYINI